jgi:hypothetical protein
MRHKKSHENNRTKKSHEKIERKKSQEKIAKKSQEKNRKVQKILGIGKTVLTSRFLRRNKTMRGCDFPESRGEALIHDFRLIRPVSTMVAGLKMVPTAD